MNPLADFNETVLLDDCYIINILISFIHPKGRCAEKPKLTCICIFWVNLIYSDGTWRIMNRYRNITICEFNSIYFGLWPPVPKYLQERTYIESIWEQSGEGRK
jgi:hypothetical protein